MPVQIAVVRLEQVSDGTEYLATLRSLNSSVLQPQVEGQVTSIAVKAGQRVQRGQVLLRIDPDKQQAAVSTQEASSRSRRVDVELARVDLERKRRLAAEGVISKQELDRAVAAFEASKAELEATQASTSEQRQQLNYFTIRAPFAGVVGDIPVRVGDRVSPATEVATVDTGAGLEAYLYVPAERAKDVKVGSALELLEEGSNKVAFTTRVSFVAPRVDPESQLVLVKAPIPANHESYRNEQLVHARIVWKQFEAPLVPVTSVSRLAGQIFAFVAESDGKTTVARQRKLDVGEVVGNNYVVLGGLKPGDKLILSGTQMLADGMPVTPTEVAPAQAGKAGEPAKDGAQ